MFLSVQAKALLDFSSTKLCFLSRTFRNRSPKMSRKGVALQVMVSYGSLDNNGSKFFLFRIWPLSRLDTCANADAMFYLCNSQFREKNPVLHIGKSPFLVLARNTIMLQYLVIHFSLHYPSSGLRRLKAKENFKRLAGSKSGCGCLREVVAFKRFQIQRFDLETFGILENWSLGRGGCNQRPDCINN